MVWILTIVYALAAPIAWVVLGWCVAQLYGLIVVSQLAYDVKKSGRNALLMDITSAAHDGLHGFCRVKMRKVMPGWVHRLGYGNVDESPVAYRVRRFAYWMTWPFWALHFQDAIVLNGLVMAWDRIGSPVDPRYGIPLLPIPPGMEDLGPDANFRALVGVPWGDSLFGLLTAEDCAASGDSGYMLDDTYDWSDWVCGVSGHDDCESCKEECEGPWDLPLKRTLGDRKLKPGMITTIRPDGTIMQEHPSDFYVRMEGRAPETDAERLERLEREQVEYQRALRGEFDELPLEDDVLVGMDEIRPPIDLEE